VHRVDGPEIDDKIRVTIIEDGVAVERELYETDFEYMVEGLGYEISRK
jgi:hypothetical protein